MPGLRQLEQFADDMKKLGDEEEIRKKNGEPISQIPLPKDISEEDDSDDFITGLPVKEEEKPEPEEDDGVETISGDEDIFGGIDADSIDGFGGDDAGDSGGIDGLDGLDGLDGFPDSDSDSSGGNTIASENLGLSDSDLGGDSLASDDLDFPNSDSGTFQDENSLPDGFGEGDGETIDMSNFGAPDEASLGDSDDPLAGLGLDDVPSQDAPGGASNGDSEDSTIEMGDMGEIDTSEMEGMNFGTESTDGEIADEFPVTGEGDDFALSDDFEIEGFTDTESADMSKKKVDTVDFSQAQTAKRDSLTEEEYDTFKKNLIGYPLNLKVLIEDAISKDDSSSFTDEVVFEIIDKVIKKTPARQLAGYMEKLLDVSIQIPRDFEKRTFEQYEAYKSSFEYKLKNRIIPGAIALVLAAVVAFGLFKLGQKVVYEPIMARVYYSQGYALLENSEFQKSEKKFEKAVEYRPVKSWFFKYARGYRERMQYERAGVMYKNILAFFNFDKKAGLEYAEMELYDRANYAEAEKIVRRYVLDYHINDPDGEMLLGDIFLEWAEVDPSKYTDALDFYTNLTQRFPDNKTYLSRMMRYYIRTDQLKNVLDYKAMFYPNNKKALSAQDWTELSGYLLDKLYGPLSRNDEYLRASIEDVRAMLEISVQADPRNPIARYNLARYFIHNNYKDQAKIEMANALEFFKNVKVRTKKNVYKEINASRILGELYSGGREYIKALEVFTDGIKLFNEEHERTGLEGDENTGRLFADIADIDYFITGDTDSALANYEMALRTKNDTPEVNFHIGYIRYGRKELDGALESFIKVSEERSSDENLLISLANVLSLKGDNFAAQSYYTDLIGILDEQRPKVGFLDPHGENKEDDHKIVDLSMKASNNLGVTLYRLAKQTGNSEYYAQSLVQFSTSMRAWDSLERDPETMLRKEGSNLAAQNSKSVMHPVYDFEPAIYTDIPKTLKGENVLE